jgi:Protein of unknown function (DUF2628)
MTSIIAMNANGDSLRNETKFVRDGFAVFAFALPVVWLLWHRLWLQAALAFSAFGLCAAFIAWNGTAVWIGFSAVVSVNIGLLVALEGGEWVRQSYERQGYEEVALFSTKSKRRAEELFASGFIGEMPRKPVQGFVPVSATNLIPLTGSR